MGDGGTSRRSELVDAFTRDRARWVGVAWRILRHDADAEDAVQDAFASALRSIDGFRGDANVSTWLHRIVCNAALMQLRRRRRRCECPLADEGEELLAAGDRAVDDELVSREQRAALMRVATGLDPESLALLTARYFDDEPMSAIARRHRITPNAAKTRVHRARASLRRLVEDRAAGDAARRA